MTKHQICVDLYFFSSEYNDIATLSDLAKTTGGQCYYYPSFNSMQHSSKLSRELARNLTRTQAWEAVVRIRSSKGIQLSDFSGSFYLRGNDLLAVPGCDSDKAFAFEMKTDADESSLSSVTSACVQAALLYTSSSGERRIRVHTVCFPITSIMSELFERVNTNAITNLTAKAAIRSVCNEGFGAAREQIRNRCVTLVRTHRSSMAAQQATQSTELSLLPLMTLGLLKNLAFKEGADVRSDVRSFVLCTMLTMGIVELETFVRPRMLPLHDLQDSQGISKPENVQTIPFIGELVGQVDLPPEAALSQNVLLPNTVFLIDNGMEFLIRIGAAVSSEWIQSVFGVSSLMGVETRDLIVQTPAPNDLTSPCRRLHNILSYLREVSSHYQQLYVVKEGEPAELRFQQLCIEDRNAQTMSLVEFDQFISRAPQPTY